MELKYTLVVERFSDLLVFLCVLKTISAILAAVGNSIVLIAMQRTPGLLSPSYVLLSGLAMSDLGVGLIAKPIFVGFNIALIQENCHLFYQLINLHLYVAIMFLLITLITLSAVTFDRFLDVMKDLRG